MSAEQVATAIQSVDQATALKPDEKPDAKPEAKPEVALPDATPDAKPDAKPEVAPEAPKPILDIFETLKKIQHDMQQTKDENVRLWGEVKKLSDEKVTMEKERDERNNEKTELLKKIEQLEQLKQLVLTNPEAYYQERAAYFAPIFKALPLVPKTLIYQKLILIQCTSQNRYFFEFECDESEHSNRYIVPIKKETYEALVLIGFTARRIADMKSVATPDFYEIRFCRSEDDSSLYFRFGIYGINHNTFYGYSNCIPRARYPFPLDKPYLEGL